MFQRLVTKCVPVCVETGPGNRISESYTHFMLDFRLEFSHRVIVNHLLAYPDELTIRNISFSWSLQTIQATWQSLEFLFSCCCLVDVFRSCSQEESVSGLETQRQTEVRDEAVKMEVRRWEFLQIKRLTSRKNHLLVFLKSQKNQRGPTHPELLISQARKIWAKKTSSGNRRTTMEHDNWIVSQIASCGEERI